MFRYGTTFHFLTLHSLFYRCFCNIDAVKIVNHNTYVLHL
jgi:hypothetical protein